MRKKNVFKIFALLLCVIMLMTALVACKKPIVVPDGGTTPPKVPTSIDLFTEVVSKMKNNYTVGSPKHFGIDVAATAEVEELATVKKTKYEVIVKASIDLTSTAKDNDSSARIEFNTFKANGEKETVFGLFYENEVVDNVNKGGFIYLSLAGMEKPLKINAFSLLQIVNKLSPQTVNSVSPTLDIDIAGILPLIAGFFLENGATNVNNEYTFTIDVAKSWAGISDLVKGLIAEGGQGLASLLGMDVTLVKGLFDQIDSIVAGTFGDLTYKVDSADKKVASLTGLLMYVDQSMPNIMTTIKIKFDGNDKLVGVNIKADYNAAGTTSTTHKFEFNATNLYIGDDRVVAVDEGYLPNAATRKAYSASEIVNLLQFNVDGTVNFQKEKDGKAVDELMTLRIDSNINPFILFNGQTAKEFKELGYFNISVIPQVADTGFVGIPVLDIYYNPAQSGDTMVYVYLGLRDKMNIQQAPFVLAGQYGIEEMIGLITELLKPVIPVPPVDPPVPPVDPPVPSLVDPSIMNAIKSILGIMSQDCELVEKDGKVTGISVAIAALDKIDEMIGGGGIFSSVISGDLKVKDLFFNTGTKKIILNVDKIEIGKSSVTTMADFVARSKGFGFGTTTTADENAGFLNLNKTDDKAVVTAGQKTEFNTDEKDFLTSFNASSENRQIKIDAWSRTLNRKVTTINHMLGVTGYDSSKLGVQTVTIYFNGSSGLFELLKIAGKDIVIGETNLANIISNYPVAGCMSIKYDITVSKSDVSITQLKHQALVGDTVYKMFQFKNGETATNPTAITSDTVDLFVGSSVAGYTFNKTGTHNIVLKINDFSRSFNVTVGDITVETKSLFVGDDIIVVQKPKYVVMENGKQKEVALTKENMTWTDSVQKTPVSTEKIDVKELLNKKTIVYKYTVGGEELKKTFSSCTVDGKTNNIRTFTTTDYIFSNFKFDSKATGDDYYNKTNNAHMAFSLNLFFSDGKKTVKKTMSFQWDSTKMKYDMSTPGGVTVSDYEFTVMFVDASGNEISGLIDSTTGNFTKACEFKIKITLKGNVKVTVDATECTINLNYANEIVNVFKSDVNYMDQETMNNTFKINDVTPVVPAA